MASINKVILIGRLGQDPEIKYTQAGKAVANFSVATTEKWSQNGQQQERTEWHNIVIWDKQAELAGQYLKKGSLIYLEGRLQTRNWDDDNGSKHYKAEVVVQIMQFLDSKPKEYVPDDRDQRAGVKDNFENHGDDLPF